jgi:hypothetical protein
MIGEGTKLKHNRGVQTGAFLPDIGKVRLLAPAGFASEYFPVSGLKPASYLCAN